MTRLSLLRLSLLLALVVCLAVACGSDDDDDDSGEGESDPTAATTGSDEAGAPDRGALDVDSTWHWQIEGAVNTGYDVDVYDIDLVETEVATIDALHRAGRLVVCYFSAGTFEEWRPDASRYPDDAVGKPLDEWPDERWIDVRNEVVRSILVDRIEVAATKGCDGVEPDNVAGYDDDTGFGFSFDDQLDFNRFLARTARDRGLLVGLKNGLSQIAELVDDYDFAVNEECHEYEECQVYRPFLDAGKPVFNAEYADRFIDDPDGLCALADRAETRSLILPLDLDDSFRLACP